MHCLTKWPTSVQKHTEQQLSIVCHSSAITPFEPALAMARRLYADKCCGTVTDTLSRMSVIMQQVPDRAASDAWFGTLGASYEFGRTPVINLARCLAADKNTVSAEAA